MPAPVAALPASALKTSRIGSIDLLRGTVMIIMALDHVRDYFHVNALLFNPLDLTRTNAPLFLTRWITHFCAPVFCMLAGTSAYLSGLKKTRRQLSLFLFTRGLWLILVEVTVITLGWTFSPFFHIFILQVIWAIGFSMLVLSVLVYLPFRIILLIGLILIGAHNMLDRVVVEGTSLGDSLWALVHEGGRVQVGSRSLVVIYPLLPWMGVMAIGYCLGSVYAPGFDPGKRKKILLRLGAGAVLLFILLRFTNLYGDPHEWTSQKNFLFTLLSFISTTKYPPSLLFLLMTLGPAFIFLAFTERPLGPVGIKVSIFGRVPMFFYVIHVYLVHLLAMIGAVSIGFKWSDMVLPNLFFDAQQLKGYGFDIVIVYMVWVFIILILYPLCKKYDLYKRSHLSNKWLSYL
jgi:uncharacterized membrane protein